MYPSFTIGESLRFGWRTMRAHSGLVFQVVLTLFALHVASQLVGKVLAQTLTGTLASLVLFTLTVFVGFGATIISLKLTRGEAAFYSDLLPPVRLTANYALASLLVIGAVLLPFLIALVVIGTVLFFFFHSVASQMVAGSVSVAALFASIGASGVMFVSIVTVVAIAAAVHIALRYSMVRFSIIDGAGVVESLHVSTKLMRGSYGHVLGFMVAAAGVVLLGFIALFVGILVAVPVVMIAYAHVYQRLSGHTVEVGA